LLNYEEISETSSSEEDEEERPPQSAKKKASKKIRTKTAKKKIQEEVTTGTSSEEEEIKPSQRSTKSIVRLPKYDVRRSPTSCSTVRNLSTKHGSPSSRRQEI